MPPDAVLFETNGQHDVDLDETQDWLDALEAVLETEGPVE